jgi:hypothetical protein
MALLTLWPAITDDTGNGTSGTRQNKALYDAIKAAVEDHTHSTTNTLIKPKDITDEVVLARGNLASLNARLSVSMNANGVITSQPTSAQFQESFGSVNLVANDTFIIWPAGDTSAPAYFAVTGTMLIQRCGSGLVDTNTKLGLYCVRLEATATPARLAQSIADTGIGADLAPLSGRRISMGCWVKCNTANTARLRFDDGVAQYTSSYHTGDNTWQWLAASILLPANITKLEVQLDMATTGVNGYFSGLTVALSPLALTHWIPAPTMYRTLDFHFPGNVAVGTNKFFWMPGRPGIIKDIQINLVTAPTGADFIADFNTWDGAAMTSMFTAGARPTIAATIQFGGSRPDTTYARRCFSYSYGATVATGGIVGMDIDQVGSGVAGAALTVSLRVLEYCRPLEPFYQFND